MTKFMSMKKKKKVSAVLRINRHVSVVQADRIAQG